MAGQRHEGLTRDALEWQYSASDTRIVSPDGTIEVNNEATIAAFELAASWVGTISPEGVTGYGEEDARGVFQAGNALFDAQLAVCLCSGQRRRQPDQGPVLDVSALPEGAAGQRAATLGGWQMAVSKYSHNPDAAAAVAVYITSYDEQKIRAIEGSFNPTIQALYEDADVLEVDPILRQPV